MKNIVLFLGFIALVGCKQEPTTLPYLGIPKYVDRVVDGETITDTFKHTISDFTFFNQNGDTITPATFEGKIYITDFFFTHCPSICPKMKEQMLRIYEKYEDNDNVLLLSHSIDTRNDTIGRLHEYAKNLGISANKWHLVTGDRQEIKRMAKDYMASVVEDSSLPGGYDHSGQFVLVDSKKHVRSFCDGTDAESVDRFMKDIDILLAEESEE